MLSEVELKGIIDSTSWTFVGQGSFNRVFRSDKELSINGYTGIWVLKCPRDLSKVVDADPVISHALSDHTRAVINWNILNPDFPAYECIGGWVAPDMGNISASDKQVAREILEIYRRTRRIIADAGVKTNFLVYKGKVVCVDVDLALRRGSVATDAYMKPPQLSYLRKHWDACKGAGMPLTAEVLQSLFYLEQYLTADEIKAEYLSPQFIAKLSTLQSIPTPLTVKLMERLLELTNADEANEIKPEHVPEFLRVGSILAPAEAGKVHAAHYAAKHGMLTLLEKLTTNDPALLNIKDIYNQGLLIRAAEKGQAAVVRFLIEKGVDLNEATQLPADHTNYAIWHNCTPLDWAMRSGRAEVVEILKAAGAKANRALGALPASQVNLPAAAVLIQHSIFPPTAAGVNTLPHHQSAMASC